MLSPSERANFFESLRSGAEYRLAINIPDIVLLDDGLVRTWLFTSKTGVVLKRREQNCDVDAIQKRFARALRARSNPFGVAAVARIGPRSQLLLAGDFQRMLERLRMRSKTISRHAHALPYCLQEFIQPLADVKFVTTSRCIGHEVRCEVTAVSYAATEGNVAAVTSRTRAPHARTALSRARLRARLQPRLCARAYPHCTRTNARTNACDRAYRTHTPSLALPPAASLLLPASAAHSTHR
jgi:hypothetical protein